MVFRKDGWRVTIQPGYVKQGPHLQPCANYRQFRSTQRLKQLVRTTRGRVIPGHDEGTFNEIKNEKEVYT